MFLQFQPFQSGFLDEHGHVVDGYLVQLRDAIDEFFFGDDVTDSPASHRERLRETRGHDVVISTIIQYAFRFRKGYRAVDLVGENRDSLFVG